MYITQRNVFLNYEIFLDCFKVVPQIFIFLQIRIPMITRKTPFNLLYRIPHKIAYIFITRGIFSRIQILNYY